MGRAAARPMRRRAGVAASRNRTIQAALEHEDVKSPGLIRVFSASDARDLIGGQARDRPRVTKWAITTTTAMISSRWIAKAVMWKATTPSSHNTARTAATMSSTTTSTSGRGAAVDRHSPLWAGR